jgi:hypothetical protein
MARNEVWDWAVVKNFVRFNCTLYLFGGGLVGG